MKKNGTEDLDNEFENDDAMYASYDAYKALIEAGVAKTDALKRTGLTAQILKDLEEEEEEEEFKDEFKDTWYDEEDEESGSWDEKEDAEVEDWDDDMDGGDDFDDADFDDSF